MTSKKSDPVVHQSPLEDQDEEKGLCDVRQNMQKYGPYLQGESHVPPLFRRLGFRGFNLFHTIQEVQDLIPWIPS